MKKLFAIFLILAMLIPMGVVAQADEVEKKPFTLVNWGSFDNIDPAVVDSFTNTFYMPYYWSNSAKIAAGEANAYCPTLGASTIETLAAGTKEWFEEHNYPVGSRHINFTMVATAVHALGDVCFLEGVAPLVSGWLDAFLKEYKRIGGELDGLVIDVEYLYTSYYYIHSEYYTKDPLVYDKIVKNPVYQEQIRPKLVERGFNFYPNPTEHTPEIYSIHPNSGSQYAASRGIWDAVLTEYKNQVITESCAPVWDYYPDAVVCDYTVRDVKPWIRQLGDHGGIGGSSGGVVATAGNASNENFYSVRPSTNFFKDSNGGPAYNTVGTYTEAVYENTFFNRFLYETNVGKETVLASTNGNVTYWMAHAYYGEKNARSPYYAELLYHLSLLDPERFLGYILPQDCKTDGVANDYEKYGHALQIVDESLRKVSELAGYADRQRLPVSKSWNEHFVVTGMYANGRNIWRITPDNSLMSVEDFQVKGTTDPTFKIQGTTVTFPGGKIIEESPVYDIGTCGYWVETPKDVYPVITKENDYFKKYPSYQENFNGFEAGMEYNYSNALPASTWENKKGKDGSAIVTVDPTDANNKVLAVKGTYHMKNVKLAKNITAGDTYAEHQAWELSFTLPADMPADAELQMLNIIPEKKTAKDQGVKVIGGKVYYDNNGQLVEMAGVTLAAGTKYTVVREFDFTVADAYTCDYYVYAGGQLVGSAKKIPLVASTELPVFAISYSATGVTGEAVLFDDYKLYPTKVNYDFYLYDGNCGVAVEDYSQPRERSTAYRFAWHNATNTEKTYTVMVAYYDGETKVSEEVVKTVKMAPNSDNFDFGVVENKQEGKKMVVYLVDNNPAENEETPAPVDPNAGAVAPTTPAAPADDSTTDNKMVIIIAAAAVVVIAVVVVVIVASKKKKKAAPAEPVAEETPEEKPEE